MKLICFISFLVVFSVEGNVQKPVGDEFWEAAKAIRAAEVVLQDAMHSTTEPTAALRESESAVVDAAAQLLRVSEKVVSELRGVPAPKDSHKKKLALAHKLNTLGRRLRLHRLNRLRSQHRHRLSARQDFNVALKSIRKAIAELKIAAWDAERRGVDSAARAAAVVVADEARRLYHLSQNMAQEGHKVVAAKKTLTKVVTAIDANLTAWSKVARKHCRHHKLDSVGSHYGSLKSAKQACEVRDNCGGIYQSGCSGFHFYLCDKSHAFEDSGTSCVYHKPAAEVPEVEPVVHLAAQETAAPAPKIPLVAKAAAAQALAARAQKESDSLMDEAIAEVATAARNAEEVATSIYGQSNPTVSKSLLAVERASEGLKEAVLNSRTNRNNTKVQLKSAAVNSEPTAPVATVTTTTTTLEMVSKVDDAFDKLEAAFKPVGNQHSEDQTEGAAEQDLARLVSGAREAPIARAFKIQRQKEEQAKEQAQEQEDEKEFEKEHEWSAEPANAEVPSAPHHNLTPEEWKEFNPPDSTDSTDSMDSTDAELNAAFEPLSKDMSKDTPQEHHNRLRTVAAAAEKAAEDARQEAEESVHEEHTFEEDRPHRRFRSVIPEVAPIEPVFKPEVEDSAGIDVPAHQLAFEKAVGMTVEPEVQDQDQGEEEKHWRNARKHHKKHHGKHKKHHSRW
jgi:hypothetical protein